MLCSLRHLRHIITSRLPLIWVFFLTYRCNSACRHCFYWKELQSGKRELGLEEIEKISCGLGSFRDLLLSGGEPTLRDDLPEICFIFFRRNKIRGINLPVNGLDSKRTRGQVEAILKKCKGVELNVGLPLDGLDETNDRLRGAAGSFRKAVSTAQELARLKKAYPKLTLYIATTVSNENCQEIIPLAKLIKTLPVDSHRIFPIRGLPKDSTLKAPSADDWRRLHVGLLSSDTLVFKKSRSFMGILRRNRAVFLNKAYADILEGRFITTCTAGRLIGVIEPDGGVRLCELTGLIGELRSAEYDIRRIWFSEKAHELRRKLPRCFCTHGCFLIPSIDSNTGLFFRSLLGR